MKQVFSHSKRRYMSQFGLLLAADGLMFGATNPRSVPSFVLAIGFLLLVLTMYHFFRGLLAIPAVYGISIRHRQRLLRTLTGLTAFLIALQSIGQLGSRDIWVVLLLAMLLFLYMSYARSPRQNLQAKSP